MSKSRINEKNRKRKVSASFEDSKAPDFIPLKKTYKEKASAINMEKEEKEDKNQQRINRNARLIVRNISFKADEELLVKHFEPYGQLLEVKLLKKPDGKLVGCAFVHFKNVPMAKEAIVNTNLKPFLGRPISVDWAVPKNKYMQHVVSKQIEMEENIKKEDSDSDEDTGPLNISRDDVKEEVKSESESDNSDEDDDNEESDEDGDDEDDAPADDDDDEDIDDDDEEVDDDKSVAGAQADIQKRRLNDAEDGCTVFVTQVPFSVDDARLRTFAERAGPVRYALVCVDKLTEHSKGTGFVKFVNKADADKFLGLPAGELRLEGQAVQVRPAVNRDNLLKDNKKQPKDNRNLYLVKEGVVVAGTRAAAGVSASDMSKRLALERSKTQMLKNLNRFVSRYRLVVSNLPPATDDAGLRRACDRAAPAHAELTEARVMRDLRAPPAANGKHPSKGYGFVRFTRHEDALACLRRLNNNPDVFDKNNRPIVSFSIEDRTALNARKKRLEKSIANNPLAQKDGNRDGNKRRNRKRKSNQIPDESYVKRGRFNRHAGSGDKKYTAPSFGKFVRKPADDEAEFTGLTAKEGSQHKMRSNHKLKTQADIHRQNVKLEKKKSRRTMQLKKAAKERIKQPKQKINKNPANNRNKKRRFNNDKYKF